jgi:hypothetical protein
MSEHKLNLTELADKYTSDKGTTFRDKHGYTLLYDDLMKPFKDKKPTFLEIGLKIGGPEHGNPGGTKRGDSPSIKMWQEYFGEVDLVGFDISDFSHQVNEKFNFIMGDSGSDKDMQRLADFRSSYDIILEDASHNSYHQQNAIKYLWKKLSQGGLFIVEDLQWQPDKRGIDFGLPRQQKTFDLFNEYFNNNHHYIGSDLISEKMMKQIKKEASYVMFFTSCVRHAEPNTGKLLVIKK